MSKETKDNLYRTTAGALKATLADDELDNNAYYAVVNRLGEHYADEDEEFNFQHWYDLTRPVKKGVKI